MKKKILLFFFSLIAFIFLPNSNAQAQVLFDNGPVFNSVGTGQGGANESILWSTALGMTTIGLGHQRTATVFNRIADEFTVPSGGWRIDSIAFFAYQTNSPTSPSTFTNVNYFIHNAAPPGGAVVFGDTNISSLIASAWSEVYRITQTAPGTARPIMRNVVSCGATLPPGTYWLNWQSAGSGPSGPWAPPISLDSNTSTTGNALQYTGSWAAAMDGGSNTPQGFPFVVYGSLSTPIANAGTGSAICAADSVMLGGNPAASGGTPPYTYSWTPMAGVSNPAAANPAAYVTATTTYTLVISDNGGAMDTSTVTITVGSGTTNVLGNDTTICEGASLTLDAGNPGSTYSWSTGATTQTIAVTTAGTYSVNIDNQGCILGDTVTVSVFPVVNLGADQDICDGQTITLNAGMPGSTYAWSNGGAAQTIAVTMPGTYSVTVTDANGCVSMDDVVINMGAAPVSAFTFIVQGNGSTVDFTDASTGGPTSWSWNFGDGSTSTLQNPSHTFTQTGSFTVTLVVDNGCYTNSSDQSVGVTVGIEDLEASAIEIFPNPNNGQFSLAVSGIQGDLELQLFDALGRILWTGTESPDGDQVLTKIAPEGIAKGVYILKLKVGESSVLRRVIVE